MAGKNSNPSVSLKDLHPDDQWKELLALRSPFVESCLSCRIVGEKVDSGVVQPSCLCLLLQRLNHVSEILPAIQGLIRCVWLPDTNAI